MPFIKFHKTLDATNLVTLRTEHARAKSLQLCLTLCNPMNYTPLDSVHEILQARILQWFAMPSSRVSSRLRDYICVSCISCIGRWVLYH